MSSARATAFARCGRALGVTAFGVNAIVYPPGLRRASSTGTTSRTSSTSSTAGRARVEVGDEVRELGEGGLVHVESTTPRLLSNASETEDLVLLVVGGKGGYVERDGHLVDVERDLPRRQSFGS